MSHDWIRWLKGTLLSLIGAVIGFGIARWTGTLGSLEITRTVDIVDLAQLLLTLILAVYLNEFFIRRSEADRSEKAYLVDLNRECASLLKHLQAVVRGAPPPDPTVVTASIKGLNSAFIAYKEMVGASSGATSCEEAEHALKCYRRDLTLGSYPWVALDHKSMEVVERSYRTFANEMHRSALAIIRNS